MDDVNVLICIRVEDAANIENGGVEGSAVFKCHKCQSDIWISPSGQRQMSDGTEAWCLQCVEKERKDEKAVVTPETINELFEQLLKDAEKTGLYPKTVYEMISLLCGKK